MLQEADLRACLDTVRAIATAAPRMDEPGITSFLIRISQAVDDARLAWGVPAQARCVRHPGLTCREAEVLHWLSGGKTDRDIADILRISPRTVHKHLQRIYDKLGVETRTAAVVRALPILQKSP